jgi:hypothetical protein
MSRPVELSLPNGTTPTGPELVPDCWRLVGDYLSTPDLISLARTSSHLRDELDSSLSTRFRVHLDTLPPARKILQLVTRAIRRGDRAAYEIGKMIRKSEARRTLDTAV